MLEQLAGRDAAANAQLKSEYSDELELLEPKLVPVASLESLDTELDTKASATSLQEVVDAIDGKMDTTNVYTESQMKAAVSVLAADTATLSTTAATEKATSAEEAALSNKVAAYLDTDQASVKSVVDNLGQPIQAGTTSKVDKSNVMTKDDLRALAAAAEAALVPLTNLISGDCDAASVAVLRYHIDKDRMEVGV